MQDVCSHRWDLYSKIPLIVKRSGAYIGVVGILGVKEKYGLQCLFEYCSVLNR